MFEMCLSDLAEVQTGYPFRSKVEHDPKGDIRVIQGKDIDPHLRFDVAKLTRIRLKGSARPENKFIQRDDVIFMTRSEKPYAVHVADEMPPTVVQNSFNTLRLLSTRDMLPEFLAMILNQSLMEARIAAHIKRATIPYIRVQDLRGVMVPVPPLSRQHSLVSLEQTLIRERQLHRELEFARLQQLDSLIFNSQ